MVVGAGGPPRLQVGVALFLVYVLWGSTYLAIRFAVESMPPFAMAATRFLVAGTLLYGWARLRGAPSPRLREWRSAAVVGTLMLLVANGAVVWAEQEISSALAALLVSTVPLFMALIEWGVFGRRPALRVGVGLLVGFAGIVLLVGPSAVNFSAAIPMLAAVGGALAWAIGTLYGRQAEAPKSALLGSAMQMFAGGFGLLLASLVTGESVAWDAISSRSLLSLAYLIVFGSLVGFTAYSWLMRNVSPTLASTYAYVNPVVAVILGWAFAGETIDAITLIASAFVVGSVGLITISRSQEPIAAPPSPAEEPLADAYEEPRPWVPVAMTEPPSGEWPVFPSG